MSVRSRLALVLALVLLPLLIGVGVIVAVIVPHRLNDQTQARMRVVASAISALQTQSCLGVGEAARLMALGTAKGEPPAKALADGLQRGAGVGAIFDGSTVLARSASIPAGVVLLARPSPGCSEQVSATATPTRAATSTSAPVLADAVHTPTTKGLITATVAKPLDRAQVEQWRAAVGSGADIDVALACPHGAAVSTATGERASALQAAAVDGSADAAQVGQSAVVASGAGHPCTVIAAAGVGGSGLAYGLVTGGALALALLAGAILVWWLARQLTLPILALTDAAGRAAEGDLAVRLDVSRNDEVGRLAGSFNHMAEQLDLRLTEIQHSRDQLRENIVRLGDALQRTHDLDGLLATVAAIAAATTHGDRATAWLLEGSNLVGRVSWPVGAVRTGALRVPAHSHVGGQVLADGLPRRLPRGEDEGALGGPVLAAPLQHGTTMLGALVVERAQGSPEFSSEDVSTLGSIAGPAGIAMDNAKLHRQAQRMAVIDPLTGVGNLRMLTTTLAREVERARHFGRSVSLLILDIDHFKEINDSHGHAAGDAILGEVATRISSHVRPVDSVARYGGEEFAVICPELGPHEAGQFAEELWQAIRSEGFDSGEAVVDVRVSVGVASWPEQALTSTELLRAADAAVSEAKRTGRDRVAQASHSPR